MNTILEANECSFTNNVNIREASKNLLKIPVKI